MNVEKLLMFLFAGIFFHQNNVCAFNKKNRILNGTGTPPKEFEFLPKLVILSSLNTSMFIGGCSSTIISKRHILTAAHCVYPKAPMDKILEMKDHIQAFLVDYRPKNYVYKSRYRLKDFSIQTKIFVHPSYTPIKNLSVDNAIIEFPEGTNLNITPITLISDFVEKDGEKAIAAGYGVYKHQGIGPDHKPINPQFPNVLQNVTVDLHTTKNCKDTQIRPYLICTGTADYRAAQGDSGGPLMIKRNGNYYQVGVLSAGLSNNALYARLSRTCGWITEVTNGEVNCQPLSSIPPPGSDKETTKVPSNIDVFAAPAPQPHHAEALLLSPSNANISFIFNILFLFICIFFFA